MQLRAKPAARTGGACLIVADGARARFFSVERVDAPRLQTRLVERPSLANDDLKAARRDRAGCVKSERLSNRQAGQAHPIDASRQQQRLELERRFGRRIAARVARLAGGWKSGVVVLIAEPRLLGLMREGVRDALGAGVSLKELAKDYTHLTPQELSDQLDLGSLFPAPSVQPQIICG